MYPSSHSRAALSSPESVVCVTFPGVARGRLRRRRTPSSAAHTGQGVGGGFGDPPEQVCPSSQIVFSMVAREPLERDVSHIVMFLTWLLESPSECEIAHMVPRARTLVPISESETKITYQVPGFSQHRRCVIARGRLRAAHSPVEPAPAFGGAPSEPADSPPRASRAFAGRVAPPRLRRRLRGHSRASEGRLRAWEGPRRSGGLRVSLRSLPGRPPGLRCSSRRALRRSRFRCPSGFPFSLSPLLYLHSIDRHPPVSSPGGVSFATFPGTIRHRRLPQGNLHRRSGKLHLRSRNLPRSNLPAGNFRRRNLPGGNLHIRSSNLRLRR